MTVIASNVRTAPGAGAPETVSNELVGDTELITRARRGERSAYDTLAARHRRAANRLAAHLVPDGEARAMVDAALDTVYATLRAGGGPDTAFRAYLLTVVRRANHARARRVGRVRAIDELAPPTGSVGFAGWAETGVDVTAAGRAFGSLPESSQAALWHTEVERHTLPEAARLLGVSGTAVAEQAYRGRALMRDALLAGHTRRSEQACRSQAQLFGPHARRGLPEREAATVAEHVDACPACSAVYPTVAAVETTLGPLVALIVLGRSAAVYTGNQRPSVTRARPTGPAGALAGALGAGLRAAAVPSVRSGVLVGAGVVFAVSGLAGFLVLGQATPAPVASAEPPTSFPVADREATVGASPADVGAGLLARGAPSTDDDGSEADATGGGTTDGGTTDGGTTDGGTTDGYIGSGVGSERPATGEAPFTAASVELPAPPDRGGESATDASRSGGPDAEPAPQRSEPAAAPQPDPGGAATSERAGARPASGSPSGADSPTAGNSAGEPTAGAPVAGEPAATQDEDTLEADLGLATVEVDPGAGPLGLPALGLGS